MRVLPARRVIVIGLDGLEPRITERLMAEGRLPNLARIREQGAYSRLATTAPAQTPVAWSTFATGLSPAEHGITDFLTRDAASYAVDQGLVQMQAGGFWRQPSVANRRRGETLWTTLAKRGIPSTVMRCPCTFPPDPIKGSLLCGMGVADLRGSFGSPTLFTGDPTLRPLENERVAILRPEGAVWRSRLEGPRLSEAGPAAIDVSVEMTESGAIVRLGEKARVALEPGEWSPWIRLHFKAGRLRSARGLVRVILQSVAPTPRLYATSIHMDPEVPLLPISEPWGFAGALAQALGPFGTAGFVEEHTGLVNGRITESDFLAQCALTHQERSGMLRTTLNRFDNGLLFCLFDTPDRVQHLFWRYGEPDHPANREHGVEEIETWRHVIDECYESCDVQVGEALRACDDNTVLVVLSDHGFGSYRRQVHLNTWLEQSGWLVRRPQSGDGAAPFLSEVDWSRTRAYALGLGGIYLNVAGRERDGIVSADDQHRVQRELAAQLNGLGDEEHGSTAVQRAVTTRDLYGADPLDGSPDILALMAPGYRASAATALGGGGTSVFEDNSSRWSGDHVVDPVEVPGVLFANERLLGSAPSLMDLAPTILGLLGVPPLPQHSGRSLFV